MIDVNAYIVCQINAFLDIRKFIKQHDKLKPTWVKSNRFDNTRIYAIAWEGLEPNGVLNDLIKFLNDYVITYKINKTSDDTKYDFGYGIDFLCFNKETGEKFYSLNNYSKRMPNWIGIKSVVVLPEMPTGEKWRFIKG